MSEQETFDWRGLSNEELEPHFNPRIAVPDAMDWLARFTSRSAAIRENLAGDYDRRYGDGEKCVYDFHPADGPGDGGKAPLVIFIHGGYWRLMDKSDHSFVVPPLTARGFSSSI